MEYPTPKHVQGVPSIVNVSKLDLGDKSENLRRMNNFEKFNMANRIFFCRKS